MDDDEKHKELRVFGVIGIFIALILMIPSAQNAFYALKGEQVQETKAVVISSRKTNRITRVGLRNNGRIYKVTYQTQSEDTGLQTQLSEIPVSRSSYQIAYGKDSSFRVFYYPSNPDRPYFNRRHPSQALTLFMIGFLTLLLSVNSLLKHKKRRSN